VSEYVLGDFEQVILMHILRERAHAFALEVRRGIEQDSGKAVSRGAFYTTLERLHDKGLVTWEMREPDNARRRGKQRCFAVTRAGIKALRHTRATLSARSARLGEILEET